MTSDTPSAPILILGAGIHGAAIARELLLNGLDVVLADSADISSGATSKSSRLIHGGLRYLEYGDVRLVRESLEERRRNLDLAPHFVQPLRLFIPVRESWSGLVPSAVGFLGWQRSVLGSWLRSTRQPRGFWPIRIGLSLYDWLARDDALLASSAMSLNDPAAPQVDPDRYRGLLAYSDAQMRYPERVVVSLIEDAFQIARDGQRTFHLATYVTLHPQEQGWRAESPTLAQPLVLNPSLIVNASGAAGDAALQALGITALPLFGGTKGSHILTAHPGLRRVLRGQAVYAEASDGRPVFTLPFGEAVLIGTTDLKFDGPVEDVVASPEEVQYLAGMVRDVFGLQLSPDDIFAHYCGVRPLPRSDVDSTAAVSRDHTLVWHHRRETPVLTLVGGKLTTWRAFAEDAVNHILGKLGCTRLGDTRQRRLPGNDPLPSGLSPGPDLWQHWSLEFDAPAKEVAALWPLLGSRVVDVLEAVKNEPRRAIADTPISDAAIRWMIAHEHVARLDDLVERRLLTVFGERLSREHLTGLAECLADCGRLARTDVSEAVEQAARRLSRHYGRRRLDNSTVRTVRSEPFPSSGE